jgi:hypothetical protein
MTRKDYVLLAAALKAARRHPDDGQPTDQECCNLNARSVARALAEDNRAFDTARFLKDAGVLR